VGSNSFFDETSEQSQVKTAIVAKYFWAWAKVVIPSSKKQAGKIAYVDLFAGPGRYGDGTASTPLRVLEAAIDDVDMREMLVTIFNDRSESSARALETAINSLPGIETMKNSPRVLNEEVGDDIVKAFEGIRLVPTLFFVDPWGYKGLSLRLVNLALKDWGCDCIFFFNYNRINMGLNNEAVKRHLDALFGQERAGRLRQQLVSMNPMEREMTIVEEISQALKETGRRYVLPFCFTNNSGNRTSHHLIFVTKHFRGYEIMKDIMAREGSQGDQGVPSFVYGPADERQSLLFELTRPLDDLEDMLRHDLAGQTLTFQQIYERHSVGRPYVARNYRQVLLKLEESGKITTVPSSRKKGTFAKHVRVTFPGWSG